MGRTVEKQIPSNRFQLSPILSFFVPGSGQFLAGSRWRGGLILLATILSAYLVNWALTFAKIGTLTLGTFVTSWLWIPFILFWVWNILDARRKSSTGRFLNPLWGITLIAVIFYVIAWQVTDVKMDRIITRFSDAKLVLRDLVNPDIATINVNGEDQICDWNCLIPYWRGKITGHPVAYQVRASDNVKEIFGSMVEGPAPAWKVSLGLAQKGQTVTSFQAGKIVETIAIGLMATLFSTILAIPVSFLAAHNIMSRFPGGIAIYYVVRTLLNIVRAIDTVVWGLIVIVWVGMGTYAGVIALTIHSVAALGKLYSEEIEHIDPGPVEALTATGATLIQSVRYAVLPQITPPFLAYTLLRWDINMRSATVIGFVAGGGIGFFVIETIRAGGYQQYAAALWAVAVVIILVDWISSKLRENILNDEPRALENKKKWPIYTRRIIYAVLGLAALIYCWNITNISISALFDAGKTFTRLVGDFVKIDLSANVLKVVIRDMIVTVFQALLATTLGALIALPFSFLAAKNLTGKSVVLAWVYYLTRSVFNILRSIEALLYVAIFIFWVGIGPFAGMLALAITTFALIGKLFSEAIENIETGPIEAVTATGANKLQMINYAILPQIVPPFVSYLIYQWDINIRMATIIGFAGGGGIGLTLSTFFGSLQYHKAGTVVAFIVVVVALMDFASAKLREKLI